jgi:hypothetical protein
VPAVNTAGTVVGRIARSFAEVAGSPQAEIGGAVQCERRHDRESGGDRVGAEEVGDPAGEDVGGVERDALDEVRKRDSPQEWRAEAPDRVRPKPGRAPAGAGALLAPLERHHADDQQHEDQQKGHVEP